MAFRDGCTAIVAVGQPTTDICSFFSRAYILVNGEVVYFGDTGSQAMSLLSTAGMPCPPLYSPVEQYIRLIDNTFEVIALLRIVLEVLATINAGSWIYCYSALNIIRKSKRMLIHRIPNNSSRKGNDPSSYGASVL